MFSIIISILVYQFLYLNKIGTYLLPHQHKLMLLITKGDLYGICAPIEELKNLNKEIAPVLNKLTETPFYRTVRVNIERECPFWA